MKPEKLIEILLRVLIMNCIIEQEANIESESVSVPEKNKSLSNPLT